MLENLAKEMANVSFLKVDVDQVPDAAEEYEIEAMPTFKLIKGGKVVQTVVGANQDALVNAIKAAA